MKGTSTLHVTEATIIAAVQMYLDDQFAAGKSPVVTGVKPRNGVGNGDGYSISVEERKAVATFTRDLQGIGGKATDILSQIPRNVPDAPAGSIGNIEDAYNKRMVGGERNDG